MELSKWIKGEDLESFPLLGIETFETFLKVCKDVSKWALDDAGLANRSDTYKIWVCWQKTSDLQKLKDLVSRYKSMGLMLHYINLNIVEGSQIGLYVALDWVQNQWLMTYGLTNNKKIYRIGQFHFTPATKLPESEILKYVKDEIGDFDPRKNFLLRKVKSALFYFDPAYCQRMDPYILNTECILSCNGLGSWNDDKMTEEEGNKWLDLFKQWVATQPWWDHVKITVRVKKGHWLDFCISPKV